MKSTESKRTELLKANPTNYINQSKRRNDVEIHTWAERK
jgi:hypothetical protein